MCKSDSQTNPDLFKIFVVLPEGRKGEVRIGIQWRVGFNEGTEINRGDTSSGGSEEVVGTRKRRPQENR